MGPYVTCMGLPVIGFPCHLVDGSKDSQTIRVPFIIYRRTEYATGAYVMLKRVKGDEFAIQDVALQPHLLKAS